MVTLNLYENPSYVLANYGAKIKVPMTDRQFLEKEIAQWICSIERKQQLTSVEYYEGRHDILKRKILFLDENGEEIENVHAPNNKIIDNQFEIAVNKKTNYFCGLPFVFDTKDKKYAEHLNNLFGAKMRRKIKLAARRSIIGGKVWVFPYYENNEFTITLWQAHEVLPFWADSEHTVLDCAVHLYLMYEYDENGKQNTVVKIEVLHGGGLERFIWNGSSLEPDKDAPSGAYLSVIDRDTGENKPYNWQRIPLICFKSNELETPLLNKVKCLQDALNLLLSILVNKSEEDIHNTIVVIENYDGEDTTTLRRKLFERGVVKVRSIDGVRGGISTLKIEVNAENIKTVIEILKESIIENASSYDAKKDKQGGAPNELNIRSMYSDIDLANNDMISEFQAGFEDLLYFVNAHLKNTGKGDFSNSQVTVVFNPDVLVNESETIENCTKSRGLISDETIVKMHPWVDNAEEELNRIKKEREEAMKQQDPYRNAFESQKNSAKGNEGGEPVNEE